MVLAETVKEALTRFMGPSQRQAMCALMPDFIGEPAPE